MSSCAQGPRRWLLAWATDRRAREITKEMGNFSIESSTDNNGAVSRDVASGRDHAEEETPVGASQAQRDERRASGSARGPKGPNAMRHHTHRLPEKPKRNTNQARSSQPVGLRSRQLNRKAGLVAEYGRTGVQILGAALPP